MKALRNTLQILLVFVCCMFTGCRKDYKLEEQVKHHGFKGSEVKNITKNIMKLETNWHGMSFEERVATFVELASFGNRIVPLLVERAKTLERKAAHRYNSVFTLIDTPKARAAFGEIFDIDLTNVSTAKLIEEAYNLSYVEDLPLLRLIGHTIAQRGEASVNELIDAFKKESMSTFDVLHFLALSSAVVGVGKPAVPSLIEMLKEPEYSSAYQDIAQLLGVIGDQQAVGVLQELLDGGTDDEGLLKQVSWALKELGARYEPTEGAEEVMVARLIDKIFIFLNPFEDDFMKRKYEVDSARQKLVQMGPMVIPHFRERMFKIKAPPHGEAPIGLGEEPARFITDIASMYPNSFEPQDVISKMVDRLCSEDDPDPQNTEYIFRILTFLSSDLDNAQKPNVKLRVLLRSNAERVKKRGVQLTKYYNN